MRRPTKYIALAAIMLLAGTWTPAYGQAGNCYLSLPGCLDQYFGSNGLVTTPSVSGAVHDVAFQNIGGQQLIVATAGLGSYWTLARYLPNGALDTSFGSGGFVTRTYKNGSAFVRHVVVQPDNCLVVAGSVPYGKPTVSTFAVARYLPDGSPDTSFGTGGLVVVPMLISGNKASAGFAHDVAVLPDGRIIAVGGAGNLVVAVRLDPFGNIDKTFGNTTPKKDGKFIHRDCDGTPEEMAIQPDGGILIAGRTHIHWPPGLDRATVMRLTPAGQLDAGFAAGGLAMLEAPGEANWYYEAMALDPVTGRIVAAGNVANVNDPYVSWALLAQYLPDGRLDQSFGTGGTVLRQWASASNALRGVAVQPDGRILAVGTTGPDVITMPPDRHLILSVWRFLADGSPDATFGLNGWVTTSFPNMGDQAWCLAQQGDGKFVVGASNFALLRYWQ